MTGAPGTSARAAGHLLAARQALPPLAYTRAEGSWVHVADGRRYLDASSGLICVNVGHAHPAVLAALSGQATVATFASPGTLLAERQERLAAETARAVHRPDDSVVFATTGTGAVEMAIALARSAQRARGETGRHRVLTASLSYHGNSALTLALSGHRRRRPHPDDAFGIAPVFDPPYPGLHPGCAADDAAGYPAGCTTECATGCADAVGAAIDAAGPDRVAAVLIETVNGTTGGGYVPPPGYLARVRRLCRERGVLVIHDEVLTGLGRTGLPLGAYHAPGSDSDLCVLAKGLGAGYVPIGAVLAAPGVAETIRAARVPLPMMGTMSATPLQAAVGSAVLGVLRDLGALELDPVRGDEVGRTVLAAARDIPVVLDVRGRGYFYGVELAEGAQRAVLSAGRVHGLLLYPFNGFRPDGGGAGVIVAPPLTVDAGEVEFLGAALRDTLVQAADAMTGSRPPAQVRP